MNTFTVRYYLAQPYTNDPEQSARNAIFWTAKLRQYGLYVFSPIMHTHAYHELLTNEADGDLLTYLATEDYVVWDLVLIEGWLKGDAYDCPQCGLVKPYIHPLYEDKTLACSKCGCAWKMWQKPLFDSGLVVIMSETAVKTTKKLRETMQISATEGDGHWEELWNSQGCRLEFEWAVDKSVRILSLEKVLLLLPLIQGEITVYKLLALAKEKEIQIEL